MKALTQKDWPALISGATFYGCGGGGDPKIALSLLRSLNTSIQAPVSKLSCFQNNDLFVTGYTVGGLNNSTITSRALKSSINIIQQRVGYKIKGVIPVEIGPLSVALAIKIAALLKIPVVDADFVGGRSTPEVFLETITLFNITRTPLVVTDNTGNQAVLETSASPQSEETFLRQFTNLSNTPALVIGYPVTKKQLDQSLVSNTLSNALLAGQALINNQFPQYLTKVKGKIMSKGTIKSINSDNLNGFSSKTTIISSNNGLIRIFAKNENLIVWLNNQPVLTCPDLITICDSKYQPIYNQYLKTGQNVIVLGMKAPPLWRSTKALNLFNPKLFGFNFKPVMIS
jgi:uncharacterized protein